MSLKNYCKDHLIPILIYLFNLVFIVFCMYLFKMNLYIVIMIISVFLISGVLIFILDYNKANVLFKQLKALVNQLDEKYIIHEMIEEPTSYEGKLLYQYLCEINAAMLNHLNIYKFTIEDFKQYLEMWIHEIKIPLASASLIVANNKGGISASMIEEINRIDNLVEQVLFYVRSENVEKDYLIKECYLDEIIKPVIVDNRKSFIYKKINLELQELHIQVNTDSKWMEFIINQIISNSIKYAKESNTKIKIYCEEMNQQVLLHIEDNGIGIASKDINQVFQKGYTGSNGRMKYKSTGIGLYLCKNLCMKMHHSIHIKSKVNEGTVVTIVFPKNKMMDIMK